MNAVSLTRAGKTICIPVFSQALEVAACDEHNEDARKFVRAQGELFGPTSNKQDQTAHHELSNYAASVALSLEQFCGQILPATSIFRQYTGMRVHYQFSSSFTID